VSQHGKRYRQALANVDRERARTRRAGGDRVEYADDLDLRERDRLRSGADDAGHARRVLHDGPRLVRHVHVHEHVARQDALLRLHLLTVLRLHHLLGRDDHPAETGLLVHGDDPVLEIGLDLVLVAGIGVDDVPAEHDSACR
jgi:hypothetical protein